MTTEYRMLEPWEPVEKGDEYLCGGTWEKSTNWTSSCNPKREQMTNTKYRRPLPKLPACVPQWKHPDAPGCPVHVLWAESPSTVRTVAQVAAEAKPAALKPTIEPRTGYRLLGDDEIVEFGDQWHNPGSSRGDWCPVTGSEGKVAGTMTFTYRRKLPAEPQYRPYANAAEAAAGLQGKLIKAPGDTWNPDCYYTVSLVTPNAIQVADNMWSFHYLLKHGKFTDGTPCGVLITNQGKQ